jgi:Fe-S-cluster-containing dehydrogenase component
MNPNSKKVEKCNGCAPLVDQGKVPDCVRGCPVQVLNWDDLATLEAKGAVKEAFGFTVFKTNPSIRFAPSKKG